MRKSSTHSIKFHQNSFKIMLQKGRQKGRLNWKLKYIGVLLYIGMFSASACNYWDMGISTTCLSEYSDTTDLHA